MNWKRLPPFAVPESCIESSSAIYLRESLASIIKVCRLSGSLQWLTCTLAPAKDSAFAGASPTCREYEGDLMHEDVGNPVPLLSRVLTVNELCL